MDLDMMCPYDTCEALAAQIPRELTIPDEYWEDYCDTWNLLECNYVPNAYDCFMHQCEGSRAAGEWSCENPDLFNPDLDFPKEEPYIGDCKDSCTTGGEPCCDCTQPRAATTMGPWDDNDVATAILAGR